MKKIALSAMLASCLFSCSKTDVNSIIQPEKSAVLVPNAVPIKHKTGSDGRVGDCYPTLSTVNLMAGQNYLAGNVTVSNDGVNLTVTYNADAGWNISQIHL